MMSIQRILSAVPTIFGKVGLSATFNHTTHSLPIRTLYSLSSLGIDGYASNRERISSFMNNNADNFRMKMNEFSQPGSTNMIFTEDLKNMIHMADKTDIDLVVNMLKKFNSQNKEVRFGNFVFGPVVMRLFYHLNAHDIALQCFNDKELDGMFDQLISYQILLDMLYEQNRFADILDVFHTIKSRQIQGGRYPRHVIVLVFGACYKENTADSFKYSKELWKELRDVGHDPMRRAATFAAGLALEKNAPDIALEILSTIRQQHYMTVRNLKVLALSQLGRADDTLPILRSVLETNDPNASRLHTFTKDVVEKVKESIAKSSNKDSQQQFERIEKFLADNGHISNTTLSELLCAEMISNTQQAIRRERGLVAASYTNDRQQRQHAPNTNRNFDNRRATMRNRPGLNDLY